MALATILFLLGSRAGATVTLESPGITVKALCAKLSEQTGRKIQAFDYIQDDLLVVRLQAVPLADVLAKLAEVERATVQNNEVRPDGKARQDARDADLARRTRRIQEIQAMMANKVGTDPFGSKSATDLADALNLLHRKREETTDQRTDTDLFVLQEQEMLRTPSGRALTKFYTSIPAEELAAIPRDSHRVWSTSPTSQETAFPGDSEELLRRLNADSVVWHDASPRLQGISSGIGQIRNPAPGRVALLRLDISSGSNQTLALTGFDSQGNVELETVASTWSPKTLQAATKLGNLDPAPPKTREIFPLPETQRQMIRLWSAYPRENELTAFAQNPSFQQIYYNPEKYDPIGQTFGISMLALAKNEGKQLLAVECADYARRLPETLVIKEGIDLAQLKQSLEFSYDTDDRTKEFADGPTWITCRPFNPEAEQGYEFSRENLGTFYRTARDNKAIRLMDVARFAADNDDMFGPVSIRGMEFLSTIPQLAGASLLGSGEWPIKSFLGRLSDAQIEQGQRPEGLALSGCDERQLHALWSALRFAQLSYNGRTDVWTSFPTDGLPNGLPGGGVLHLSIAHGESFVASFGEPGERSWPQHYTLSRLVDRMIPGRIQEKEHSYNLQTIAPEQDESYVFDFTFPGELSYQFRIDDYRPLQKTVKSVSELPEPYKTRLEDAIKKATTSS